MPKYKLSQPSVPILFILTHWGRVTHICVSNPTIIDSDNGLLPSRHQAIIWTNAGILLIWPLGTNFSEILIEIHIFSFMKVHLKWLSGKWRSFCPGLNVLRLLKLHCYNGMQTYVSIYNFLVNGYFMLISFSSMCNVFYKFLCKYCFYEEFLAVKIISGSQLLCFR